jgi:hypothetical protein
MLGEYHSQPNSLVDFVVGPVRRELDRFSSEASRMPRSILADLPPRRTTLHNDTAEPGGTG